MRNIVRYKSTCITCKREYLSLSWSCHVLCGVAVLGYCADNSSIEKPSRST